MPPFIVDLSQDSDEEYYVYPPKRPLPTAPPQRIHLKTSTRTPTTIRKARPSSSSSSSIISFLSSPPARKVQAQITTFFSSSPIIKKEPKPMLDLRLIPSGVRIHFERWEIDVDDIEAPLPDPFDFVEPTAAKTSKPKPTMEIEHALGSAASPVVLTSSPPAPPVRPASRTVNGASEKRTVLKRSHPEASVKSRPPLWTPSLPRPMKAMRKKAELTAATRVTATANGGMLTIKMVPAKSNKIESRRSAVVRKNDGVSTRVTATANGGMLTIKMVPAKSNKIGSGGSAVVRENDGVSTRFRTIDRSAQIKRKESSIGTTGVAAMEAAPHINNIPAKPLQVARHNNIDPLVADNTQPADTSRDLINFTNTGTNEPEGMVREKRKRQEEPIGLICKIHSDPDCNEVECVMDFFVEYSPFHDTLPDDNQVSHRGQQPAVVNQSSMPAVSLSEDVVDIRKLGTQLIACLLASDSLDPRIHRPYMTLKIRAYIKHIKADPKQWHEIFKECDGDLVHVGFTPKECELLGRTMFTYLQEHPTGNNNFPEPCESGDVCEDLHNYLKTAFAGFDPAELSKIYSQDISYPLGQLPGRYKHDCVNFLIDATNHLPDVHDHFIRVHLSKKLQKPQKDLRRLMSDLGLNPRANHARMQEQRAMDHDPLKKLQPVWYFNEGSSDILDIQWSSDATRFVMASACFSDVYNRPGNLMLGTSDPWGVKMLYRHAFRIRQQPLMNLDRFLYMTVSSVRYSNDGSFFYSGGYDGFVKTWEGKTGQWIADIPLREPIMTMATSPLQDGLLAAATKDGTVHLINTDEGGRPVDIYELPINKEDQKRGLYASCLVFGNKLHPDWLITGYDTNNDGTAHGGLAVYDVETGQIVFGLHKSDKRIYNTRHFDIAMHEHKDMLVTASLAHKNKVHSPGIYSAVRIFDMRDMQKMYSPILLKSPQRDINKVTISPCGWYITSSSTAGSTLVWDIRNPNEIMTELRHEESKIPLGPDVDLELDDTGVTYAQWGPHNSRFYTGSSDGIVKEWDITAGNPFIRDIAKVNTQIMSASFSPSWDELIVGECSGAATLFSTRGDEDVTPSKLPVDWTEHPGTTSPDDDTIPIQDWPQTANANIVEVVAEEEDSGVLIARQLVAEGKMWIDGRWAWATDDVVMGG